MRGDAEVRDRDCQSLPAQECSSHSQRGTKANLFSTRPPHDKIRTEKGGQPRDEIMMGCVCVEEQRVPTRRMDGEKKHAHPQFLPSGSRNPKRGTSAVTVAVAVAAASSSSSSSPPPGATRIHAEETRRERNEYGVRNRIRISGDTFPSHVSCSCSYHTVHVQSSWNAPYQGTMQTSRSLNRTPAPAASSILLSSSSSFSISRSLIKKRGPDPDFGAWSQERATDLM
ncbi:hypothetical protein PVAG01_10871 [Phlyctema vagabunda]|uniref:Uncharacterized protein n=1 Tax=Phlyctema vagabunda TaxID=108571 RepID=A0ABR4P444_9HELO